jgi:hypothetical protein
MPLSDWPVVIAALFFAGLALACLIGVILLNWRRPRGGRRGFEVTARPGRFSDPE